MNKNILTKKGLEKLKKELKERESVIRKKIADKLDEAKAQGDLSENAAYTSALEEYQMNENKIRELKNQISKSKVAPNKSGDNRIDIGDKVKVKETEGGKEIEYSLVGDGEGDPQEGLISINSIVGKAFVNKEAGDIVEVDLPAGKKEYKIVKVY